MTSITEKVDAFVALFDQLREDRKTANKNLSSVDSELSNWYHRVEGVEIKHISESHKLIKEVQDILQRRRDIKLDALILSSVVDNLDMKIVKVAENTAKCVKTHQTLLNDLKTNAK